MVKTYTWKNHEESGMSEWSLEYNALKYAGPYMLYRLSLYLMKPAAHLWGFCLFAYFCFCFSPTVGEAIFFCSNQNAIFYPSPTSYICSVTMHYPTVKNRVFSPWADNEDSLFILYSVIGPRSQCTQGSASSQDRNCQTKFPTVFTNLLFKAVLLLWLSAPKDRHKLAQ